MWTFKVIGLIKKKNLSKSRENTELKSNLEKIQITKISLTGRKEQNKRHETPRELTCKISYTQKFHK